MKDYIKLIRPLKDADNTICSFKDSGWFCQSKLIKGNDVELEFIKLNQYVFSKK